MPFKINARTMLQLGAELISSDAVAFYELIKNAFDARSKNVEVLITFVISRRLLEDVRGKISQWVHLEHSHSDSEYVEFLQQLIEDLVGGLSVDLPDHQKLVDRIEKFKDLEDILHFIDDVNRIEINDTGTGMSHKELDDVYLTIGTRSRLIEKKEDQSLKRPILGEKGIGRLSAMRLGRKLLVTSSKSGDTRWNTLSIDWRKFDHESDELLENIEVNPQRGEKKDDDNESGTKILITALESDWDWEKAKEVAVNEFAKLRDPFERANDFPVKYKFNGKPIPSPRLEKDLLNLAHAYCEASLNLNDGEPHLTGHVDYTAHKEKQAIDLTGTHLVKMAGVKSEGEIRAIGQFTMQFYWYNRQLLFSGITGIDRDRIKQAQSLWAGGLMVYRDGFRVYPYGSAEDDWLDLDKKALASSSYKVNRRQIIGRVAISSRENPDLVDQTNREGLRDCAEKSAFKSLLKGIIVQVFKSFLIQIDKKQSEDSAKSLPEIQGQLYKYERSINKNIQAVLDVRPELSKNESFQKLSHGVESIKKLLDKGRKITDSIQESQERLVHLAGLGLMVESIGHELNRSVVHILSLLHESRKKNSSLSNIFTTIEAQVKTLQKRLSILDPLAISGRQRKESFEMISWIKEIVSIHAGQFKRHKIDCRVDVRPPSAVENGIHVNLVKGMIVQILENLINNSIYWLKAEMLVNNLQDPQIIIEINARNKSVSVTDNGPGIQDNLTDIIFEPHFTTKPPKEGKGLGLYIAREVAVYNKCTLEVDPNESQPGIHNTFILSFQGADE